MKSVEKKEKEFIRMYDCYHQDIFRYCMIKTNDRALSIEITQEVFTRLWEHFFLKEKKIEREKALLYKIANNLIIDFHRKKKIILKDSILEFEKNSWKQYNNNPKDEWEQKIDGESAFSLLYKLPESMREVILLRYVHGLSVTEIAESMGKKSSTISVLLHRSLKKLREMLNEKKYE